MKIFLTLSSVMALAVALPAQGALLSQLEAQSSIELDQQHADRRTAAMDSLLSR
jgi:hypothetical protein